MKKVLLNVVVLLVLILPAYITILPNLNELKSAPPTSLKDQLSSAQLSFFARISSFTGSSIKIDTTANPSRITANLFTGDTLAIANVGVTTSTQYLVKDIGDTAQIDISAGIASTTPNGYIIATRSAVHTVSFIPQTAISGEKWQFLIKSTGRSGELFNDGIPDQAGFDIGADIGSTTTGIGTRLKAADISCPGIGTTTAISIGTTVNITSGINLGFTGVYSVVECDYAVGVSNPGTGSTMTMVIGRTNGSQLINPSPGLNHTPGQADNTSDVYTYAVRQLDNSSNVLDITFGKIAVTESVRVTAIVDPTITFTIGTSNTSSIGTTRCGSPLGNYATSTTPYSVSFGPLSLATYNNLAQSLQCTTNSSSGYVIQAYENRSLTMLGATTTIPDTTCEGGTCSSTSAGDWTSFSTSGFGYSLEVGTTTGTTATLGIATAGQYKSFGSGVSNAQPILSRTNTPLGTDSIYICYRTVASTVQPAGTYENSVSFIATATF